MSAFVDDDDLSGPGPRTPPVDIGSLHLLIYSYLLHNNCGRSAKAFARTCGLSTSGCLTGDGAPKFLSTLPASDADNNGSAEDESASQYSTPPQQHQQQQQESASSVAIGKRPASSGMMVFDEDDSLEVQEKCLDGASAASQKGKNNGDERVRDMSSTAQTSFCETNYIHDALCTTGAAPSGAANTDTSESDIERANKLIDHHIECLRIRQSICSSIEAGEPEVALDLLTTYFRAVLIPPPAESLAVSPLPLRSEFNATLLRFRLDTQYYVELITKHQELDALIFGQRTLWRYPDIFDTWLNNSLGISTSSYNSPSKPPVPVPTKSAASAESAAVATSSSSIRRDQQSPKKDTPSCQPQEQQRRAVDGDAIVSREELKQKRAEIMQHITNVAALVAYHDPHKSILAYLLSQERRNELASAVNAAILRTLKFPREPAMVTLVRQLATTSACLVGYPSSSTARSNSMSSQPTSDDLGTQGSGTISMSRMNQPWVLDMFVNSDSEDNSLMM
ncbi:hypothetical protein IW140_003010 [Coemansia sp. RSA 1813]|nr:hypothetical protein EV178_001229 [Coemansia sp. RSA 1646]KAJ1772582.1 hypothetical protein LPJ74_001298 [Coemansia sp. RSA 1843]KAJ2091437.1 hypothetical protein IW138_001896 [Coemansia sp. RSA 986]KAJ2213898.1 hypothetical protein EV179_003482 [Coemansia sp. RSA 487]KAJ2569602.1 hypothetical protein IW140_003010 [Coemansia sp. RSA 1813]